MVVNSSENDMRTFRDFLLQYNEVTEQCFNACVTDFSSRAVKDTESKCSKNCLDKYLKMTQRLSTRFQEHHLMQAESQGATPAMPTFPK